jgi:hypothetical protein
MSTVDIYFKVATTKRSPQSQIVELAAVDRYSSGFVRVINPTTPITHGATQAHRISRGEDGYLYRNGERLNGVSIGKC